MFQHNAHASIAVIGGGRWARVYLSVLDELRTSYSLTAVTARNSIELERWRGESGTSFAIVSDLAQLFAAGPVAGAVIVNAARKHEATVRLLLNAGVPMLVEKPLALTREAVEALFEEAAQRHVRLVPALTFRACSYLERFSTVVGSLTGTPRDVSLKWQDSRNEVRYGDLKTYDPSVSVAQDVMPHVWSILSILTGSPSCSPEVKTCAISRGGRRAEFALEAGDLRCNLLLERDAPARSRRLHVSMSSGERATIDFTREPGVIEVNGKRMSGDEGWPQSGRPIRRLLGSFLDELGLTREAMPSFTDRNMGVASVALADDANKSLGRCQQEWLETCSVERCDDDVFYALRERMVPYLHANGQCAAGDVEALDSLVRRWMAESAKGSSAASWGQRLRRLSE